MDENIPLPRSPREPSASPRIGVAEAAAYGELPAPRPHTEAELAGVLGLLTIDRPRVEAIALGHGRDDASRAAVEAFAAVWRERGGQVVAVADWPESAASWLRPARRLTAQAPDAWVVAAAPLGFAQLVRRLRHSTGWDPARTVAFASLQDSRLPALAGPGVLDGLRGATAEGGTWEVRRGWVTRHVHGQQRR